MSERDFAAEAITIATRYGLTLACAESCTGGMIASSLTAVPGASATFLGGVVSYASVLKETLLGVPHPVLERYGVVSSQCAEAMAYGVRELTGSDFAVSTTGLAGPTGAEPGKPIGTVWFGVAGPGGCLSITTCRGQGREEIRTLATETALSFLLTQLEAHRDCG